MKIGITLGLGGFRPVPGGGAPPIPPNALKTSDGFILQWRQAAWVQPDYGPLKYTEQTNG